MSWYSILAICCFSGFTLLMAIEGGNDQEDRHSDDVIQIEMTGVLRNRMDPKSGKLLSSRVYNREGRMDLDLESALRFGCEKRADQKVLVKGRLVKNRNRRDDASWCIVVEALEGQGTTVPWPPLVAVFQEIVIEREGGFAGLSEKQTVTPEGQVVTRSLRGDDSVNRQQLDDELLRQLHRLVQNTNWQHIHLPNQNPLPNVSDQMQVRVVIQTEDRNFRFVLSSPGTDQIQPLSDLIELVSGKEP